MWRMFGSGHLPAPSGPNGYTGVMTLLRRLLLGGALALVPALAAGQGVEAVGMRALGMGGAFVAVADDASATYWNPAGLVTGSMVSAVAEVARGEFEGAPVGGANPPMSGFAGQGSTLVALGTWPVGATFYRLCRRDRPGGRSGNRGAERRLGGGACSASPPRMWASTSCTPSCRGCTSGPR